MAINAKTKVFVDLKGNKMVFPSLIIWYGKDNNKSEYDISTQSMMIGMIAGCEVEKEWMEFDGEKFPHVNGMASSSGFQYGAATAYVFAGPTFDECFAEHIEKEKENG